MAVVLALAAVGCQEPADPALGNPTHIAVDQDQGPRDGGLAFTAQLLPR